MKTKNRGSKAKQKQSRKDQMQWANDVAIEIDRRVGAGESLERVMRDLKRRGRIK